MKLQKIFLGFSILALLSCNYITQMIVPPTPTAIPTATATATLTPTPTPVPIVPAFIPPECADKPLATVAPDAIAQVTPAFPSNTQISKRSQLAVLDRIDNIVKKVYVYPDYNGKDWKEIVSRYREKIQAGLDTEVFYTEMQKMITELGDDHSFFLSPVEVQFSQDELEGDLQYTGIGISANFQPQENRIVVVAVYPDSSAEHAGIQAHDSIVSVDNLPVFTDTTDQAIDRLHGPKCSAVMVTVVTPGQEPRQVMLVRHQIHGNVKVESRRVPTTDGSKIGYIEIPSFYDEAIPGEVKQALNDFGSLDGLILDVRMNGGGVSTVADAVMSYFTSGTLGKFVSRKATKTLELEADPVQNSQTVPLVVLVNKGTASYGELFAGIMKDSRGAKVTGETSLGNVERLSGFDFDDGSQLWIASEKFVPQHSKDNWEETGIVTDIEGYADWSTYTFDTDPAIAAALTLLGHK
jgi:carboxyl-terminal processing protease